MLAYVIFCRLGLHNFGTFFPLSAHQTDNDSAENKHQQQPQINMLRRFFFLVVRKVQMLLIILKMSQF